MERMGQARLGRHGSEMHCMSRIDCYGAESLGRLGWALHGAARSIKARKGRRSRAWIVAVGRGFVRSGLARQAWQINIKEISG